MHFVSIYYTSFAETNWVTQGNFHYVGGQNEQGFTRSYLVQPDSEKHWSYAEWLWMQVSSRHPYVLAELRRIRPDSTIVHDDRFTVDELLEIGMAAGYLAAGGNPESYPRPEQPDNWMDLISEAAQPAHLLAIV